MKMRIDLRSDTVTQPSAAMREAMARAEVGDDVLGDDPTVRALEERTAELLGKEAAVFMPSGTMANQVAVRTHTEPGDEVFLHRDAHIYYYEAGASATLSGVMCCLLEGERGVFTAAALTAAVRPPDVHFPNPRLVCVENTVNRGAGKVWPPAALAEVEAEARRHGLQLHLDGARLWNAAIALGVPEVEIARHFDSVSVCFSKGLGAPIGSALAGDGRFIKRARRFRKQFGGGMRQAGIVAAGALFALEHNRSRLAEDHRNAQALAEGLVGLPHLEVAPNAVETNIVMLHTTSRPAAELVKALAARGVLVLATGPDTVRAVTNLMVTDAMIPEAVAGFEQVLTATPSDGENGTQ